MFTEWAAHWLPTAGVWSLVAMALTALIRNRPAMRKIDIEGESLAQQRLTARIVALEAQVEELHGQLMMVAGTLVDVIGDLPADSNSRMRAKAALRTAFPLKRDMPDDMADLTSRLNRGN